MEKGGCRNVVNFYILIREWSGGESNFSVGDICLREVAIVMLQLLEIWFMDCLRMDA